MSELHAVPKPGRAKRVRRPMKKSRMKSYNAKRKGHKFPKNVDELYRVWVRMLPCAVYLASGRACESWWRVHAAHIKSRGAGGPDRQNLVPLCAAHHALQHDIGIRSFQKRYGVDLKKIAHALTEQYERECEPCL